MRLGGSFLVVVLLAIEHSLLTILSLVFLTEKAVIRIFLVIYYNIPSYNTV